MTRHTEINTHDHTKNIPFINKFKPILKFLFCYFNSLNRKKLKTNMYMSIHVMFYFLREDKIRNIFHVCDNLVA